MILQKLTAVGADGSRVMLWFDDGTKMRVAARVVLDRGLYQGMELSEAELETLRDSARRASARDRAVRIVSATAISEQSLRRRLVQRGETPEDAKEAAAWLRELGAVDDAAMAKTLVRRCLHKGYGLSRIRQELYQKGIPREHWEEALRDLPDMSEAVDRFLSRQFRGTEPDDKAVKKAAAALQRRGHNWEDIRAGLRRYTDLLEREE